MSHTATVAVEFKNPNALEAACRDLAGEVLAVNPGKLEVLIKLADGTTETVKVFRDTISSLTVGAKVQATITPHETVTFYDRTTVTGTAIRLPGWRYPVVIPDNKALSHEVVLDDYKGVWGDMKLFKRLKHSYATHTAIRTAEQTLGRKVVGRKVVQTAKGIRTRLELA